MNRIMDDSSSIAINAFALIGYFGAAIVVFGVFGELKGKLSELIKFPWFRAWTKKKFSRRWLFVFIWYANLAKPKMLVWETVAILIVIAGLAIEWLGGGTAEIMQSRENAVLYSEGESNAVRVAQLQLQIEQASNSIAQANEGVTAAEMHGKTLQILLNETKTELANAETRLNASVEQLNTIASPMDIGNEDSLAAELESIQGIDVELRTSTDANAQHTADSMAATFFIAHWPVINRSFIGDIGKEGIVIGHAWDDDSIKAAKLLRKVLIERNLPVSLLERPNRVGPLPTNTIIVAVMERPDATNAQITIADSKYGIDNDEINAIQPEIWKLLSEKFKPGSKELAEAQSEFNDLNSEYKRLSEDQRVAENEMTTLFEGQREAEEGTNFNKPGIHVNGGTVWGGTKNYITWPNRPTNTVVEVHGLIVNPEVLK
jgi:hypothetical protein